MDLIIALLILLVVLALIGYGGAVVGNLFWILAVAAIVLFLVWLLRLRRL